MNKMKMKKLTPEKARRIIEWIKKHKEDVLRNCHQKNFCEDVLNNICEKCENICKSEHESEIEMCQEDFSDKHYNSRFIDPVKAIKKIAECIKNPPKNLSGDILNEYLMGLKVAGGCITETPSEDVVSRAVFDQFKWERDMAFKTLEEHGLSLGKIKEE